MDPISIILIVVFGVISLLLVGIVLLQNEQSEGLGGIFGGGSSNQIGNRKGNILTRMTGILGALFLMVCFGLALINSKTGANVEDIIKADAGDVKQSAVKWYDEKAADAINPTVLEDVSTLPSPSPSAQP